MLAEGSEALEIDTRPAVCPDENHEHAVAGATADDRARRLHVDGKLGDLAAGPATAAHARGGRHLGAEDLVQQAAYRVPVDSVRQVPPVAPNRSVFTRSGG